MNVISNDFYLLGDYLICLEDSSKKRLIKGKKYRVVKRRGPNTFFVVDETGELGWWSEAYFFNISNTMREMFHEAINSF